MKRLQAEFRGKKSQALSADWEIHDPEEVPVMLCCREAKAVYCMSSCCVHVMDRTL
jgi:hypothetical protein